jgi:hypothetical protein
VRRWLDGRLEAEKFTVALDEPVDWSSWDPERRQ